MEIYSSQNEQNHHNLHRILSLFLSPPQVHDVVTFLAYLTEPEIG
jgi:hypothetical protein